MLSSVEDAKNSFDCNPTAGLFRWREGEGSIVLAVSEIDPATYPTVW